MPRHFPWAPITGSLYYSIDKFDVPLICITRVLECQLYPGTRLLMYSVSQIYRNYGPVIDNRKFSRNKYY